MVEVEHVDLEEDVENDEGATTSAKNQQATKDDKPLLSEVDIVGDTGTKNAGGSKVWVCKHCNKKFTSSYTRMHIHFFGPPVGKVAGIQRCTALIKDRVKYESLLKKVKSAEQAGVSRSLKNSVINKKQVSNSKKPLEESFGVMERNAVDMKVMKGLCANAIPFNVLRNPQFQEMVTGINRAPAGYKAPHYDKARTVLLDECVREVEKGLTPVKDTWYTQGCSIVSDGWSNVKHEPLINVIAANSRGAVFIKATNFSGVEKTGAAIAEYLLDAIKSIGPNNVLQVVTDNAANCKAAGKEVEKAIGQAFFLRPYVDDFSTQWVISSVVLLTLGSVFTTYIGERITDLKLGNGTSLLIFTSIISYLPASFGRTVAEAFQDGNYLGLIAIIMSFFLLVLSIVYVQEAERKIPINYASRYSSRAGGTQKSAYLPFKVNSSGVMPIIFSTSSLALPATLARFTGLNVLKNAAVSLNPGGAFYLPTNILLIAFFNYYYTFLQLDPDDVSEQLKRQGASIPLVRPGKSTAAFIKTVLSRISVLGSVFLAILAAGPAVVEQTTHLTAFRGFAGTSVLILVGCATDTARKVQAEIISQKYKNIEFYEIDKDTTF